MSTRKLLVLLGTFVGLLLFVVLYERHLPTSEEAAKAKKKLADFKPEEVDTILVERPDLPAVSLQRLAGGKWKLASGPGGAADVTTADGLVADLGKLELVGEVRTKFDPKEYGLDAPKATATVSFKKGDKKVFKFGSAIAGTDATAASVDGRFGAVKYAPMTTMAKPLDDFRSKALVEVPSSEITRLTISRGTAQIVAARDERPDKTAGAWRLEAPVKDLASQTFVDQLLSDITAARITEFPTVPATELGRIGLAPPAATIVLQKGKETVATIELGAAKAETTGKIYARLDTMTVLIDDRLQDGVQKELSAFRESRVCPVDSWAANRISFDGGGIRVGAERVEGEWRTAGKSVSASLPEDLVDKISRAEAKRFVARKDYAAYGVPVAKGKKGVVQPPIATYEVTTEKGETLRASFFPAAPLDGQPVVAVEMPERAEALLVERAVLDEMLKLAGRIRDAALGLPTPTAPAVVTAVPVTPAPATSKAPVPGK